MNVLAARGSMCSALGHNESPVKIRTVMGRWADSAIKYDREIHEYLHSSPEVGGFLEGSLRRP